MTRFFANSIAAALFMLGMGGCLFALAACDYDDTLYAVPESKGSDIEARRPSPPPDPEPECGVRVFWPLDQPPLGVCSPGWVDTCTGTEEAPKLPVPERACNGLDDDCDGQVDEGPRTLSAAVVYMDFSGSMAGMRDTFSAAFCSMTTPHTQWKLIAFGVDADGYPYYDLIADWAYDTQAICDILLTDPWFDYRGVEEYAGQVIGETSEFLEWPDGHARHIVTITDEVPQHIGVTDGTEIVLEKCIAMKAKHWTFTYPIRYHHWQDISQQCGGNHFSMAASYQTLAHRLSEAVAGGC